MVEKAPKEVAEEQEADPAVEEAHEDQDKTGLLHIDIPIVNYDSF